MDDPVIKSVIKSVIVLRIYAELDCFQNQSCFQLPSSTSLPNYKGTGPPARSILSMSSAGNNNNNYFKNYLYLSRVIGYNLT